MPLRLSLVVVIWLVAITAGFGVLYQYQAAAGPAMRAPAVWPAESVISRDGERPLLLVFLHPHCPCSRASVAELGRLLQRVRDRVSARVLLVRPAGVEPGWESTRLRDLRAALPAVTVAVDEEGREAARFGAATSGVCMLYDRQGRLMFAGGITALRGHEGDSLGQERIVSLVGGGAADRNDSPVFGCPLSDTEASTPTARSTDATGTAP